MSKSNSEFLEGRPQYVRDISKLTSYIETTTDWQALHGLLFRAPLVPAPVALAPSPVPRSEFEKVVALQPILNLLFDAISQDSEFLITTLQELGTADIFTSRILDMYKRQLEQGVQKPGVIAINRSDYLMHAPESEPDARPLAKQVEFNTIASSFGSLSTIVGNLHRYLLSRTGYKDVVANGSAAISESQLPANESLTSIADGIAAGFKLYGNPQAIVVMVVQPGERNVYDQRWIEQRLWDCHRIKVKRMSFGQIADECTVLDDCLLVDHNQEVAVAYYRAGYAPSDFPSEKEWDGRWKVEQSRAIAVPNLAYHLAGCKKIQQVLAQPGVLERFVKDPHACRLTRECFVGLYPLDESLEGQAAYRQALETPHNYVVKPQREGGGYNTYGDDIPELLGKLSAEERKGYILMELIRAPGFNSVLLRNGELVVAEVVSELGIYGILVRDTASNKVVVNQQGGHLLRTKASDVYEGGVAAGFAVIDSPLLI